MQPPLAADDWVGLSEQPLPVSAAYEWTVRRDCGAVVMFSGTARDHSAGRPGVHRLEYEAYEAHVEPALRAIADEARRRWPTLGRLAMLHRTGEVPMGDTAVVVVVSAPHRDEAFLAARFCIDALKASAPIWKKEAWDGGESWALESQQLVDPADVVGR
jgi:molybdopterin synthase catalytic subunit